MLQNNDNNYAKQNKWQLINAYKWDKRLNCHFLLIWVSPKSRFNILCCQNNDNNYAKQHKLSINGGILMEYNS